MFVEKLPNHLLKIIKDGEGITVEFKEAKKNLPGTLFESICAMLNRFGGHIFLGIKDDGTIIGVNKDIIPRLKKDFSNLCNNPEKLFPTVHLDLDVYKYQEKYILYTYVFESSDVHKSAGKVFDRNMDGDYDITISTSLIAQAYIRKSNEYIENKIYPYFTIDDFRKDLIDKVRKRVSLRNSNHPWSNMNDMDLLKSARLYEYDGRIGKEGFNLACILLFGKDETIKSALPYFYVDAIYREKDMDRYDDRLYLTTNLLETYDKLMEFVKKHTDDRFYLENNVRISPRDIIARELCVNILIHREYSNSYPTRLIITKNEIYAENANRPKRIGRITPQNLTPDPKNPKLALIFKELGLAEELGSGVRKMYKYTKIYSGSTPILEEGDMFKTTIFLNSDNTSNKLEKQVANDKKTSGKSEKQAANDEKTSGKLEKQAANDKKASGKSNIETIEEASDKKENNQIKIIEYIKNNGFITTDTASKLLHLSKSRARAILSEMRNKNILISIGADKVRKYKLHVDN